MAGKGTVFGAILMVALVLMSVVACDNVQSAVAFDPLDGTSWTLVAYRKTSPIEGTMITAEFKEGIISGTAGCNHYTATYNPDGDAVTVGAIAVTEMACMEPEGVMEQEMVYLGYLSQARDWSIDGDTLMISCPDHEKLTFKAR